MTRKHSSESSEGASSGPIPSAASEMLAPTLWITCRYGLLELSAEGASGGLEPWLNQANTGVVPGTVAWSFPQERASKPPLSYIINHL